MTPSATRARGEQLPPDYHSHGIARWYTEAGTIVADSRTDHTGVYFYAKNSSRRLVDNPEQLAAALLAATTHIAKQPTQKAEPS